MSWPAWLAQRPRQHLATRTSQQGEAQGRAGGDKAQLSPHFNDTPRDRSYLTSSRVGMGGAAHEWGWLVHACHTAGLPGSLTLTTHGNVRAEATPWPPRGPWLPAKAGSSVRSGHCSRGLPGATLSASLLMRAHASWEHRHRISAL